MRTKRLFTGAASLIFWLAVWQLCSAAVGLDVLLPSPVSTFSALLSLIGKGDFWITCLFSLLRITAGLAAGTLLGVLLAVLTEISQVARALISPALTAIRATPVASFIILALVWIGKARVPAFTSMLMVLPVIWSAVSQAISDVDVQLLEIGSVFNFGPAKRLRHIYIPSVRPAFLSAFVTSVGLAWKAGVAAEVLCTPQLAIGSSLYDAKVYLETPKLFAWTLTVVLLSLALEKLARFAILSSGKRRLAK